ncbi:MAG: outer spore coat protein CotE [Bacilli bacterium]|nr:outer spore coat protein CotE [Bacilli bacterium]
MASYKEIVTKAVVGKGKLATTTTHTLKTLEEPAVILGCWVINHTFKGTKDQEKVIVKGKYDVNIWYSTNNNTKTEVAKDVVEYTDTIDVVLNDDYDGQDEIIVRAIKQPTCIKAEIKDNEIVYTIEKELASEIVGDTKIRIGVESDREEDAIDGEIKEDFLN